MPSVWNVANALTLLRLVLVPVFLVLLFATDGPARVAAFVIFSLAMVTDRIDGELARSRGLVTDVGKIADPIADKALTGSAFIALSALDELPWWVTVVVLVRELGITALRFVVIRRTVVPASRGGKTKTGLQALALGLYILPLPVAWQPVQVAVMTVAVVVTVGTGLDYVYRMLWRDRDGAVT